MTALPRTELDTPRSSPVRAPSTADQLSPAPDPGWRARLTRSFLGRVVRRVPVSVREADGSVLGARSGPARPAGARALPEIVITDPDAFYARVGRSPMIGLGESY
ncbi:MAG TPA: hypothetical protein VFG88_01215, partial [Nocardioidaceae bacterium]|nr:hypothetical protein [Nocardioidaceae bacterium]